MQLKSTERPRGAVADADVRRQLELLFASDSFRSSKRCQLFLEFVVERTLAGRGAELREKVIGVEVFQRHPGYDSSDDPVVRATAGDIRKRLAQYYQEPMRAGELRIDLQPGSYVPEFRVPAAEAVPQASDSEGKADAIRFEAIPRTSGLGMGRRWLVALVGIAALSAAGWWVLRPAILSSRFERFWAPLLTTNCSVMICVGQAKLYNFPRSVGPEIERVLDPRRPQDGAAPGFTPAGANALLRNIQPVWDRYVPLGDAEALTRIAILLEHKAKPYRIRGSALTSLADLREGAAVLIGAFSNDWTLRTSRDLRYRLARAEDFRLYVEDTRNPASRRWLGPKDGVTTGYTEGADFADYAILSRVFDPTTGRPMISIGGITHLATAAAGEFLTTPASLNEALEGAAAGWERKNVQMVIEIKVIGHGATPPRVLAMHIW
jgi:hypothetical protein